jgi:lycopene cyclase domain-containing protein
MDKWAYLLCLCIAITCLAMIDRRYKLVFWYKARQASQFMLIGVAFFLAWDLCGIGLHIFQVGDGRFMTGLQIVSQLPIEEPIFLGLLLYQTLITWELVGRWHAR